MITVNAEQELQYENYIKACVRRGDIPQDPNTWLNALNTEHAKQINIKFKAIMIQAGFGSAVEVATFQTFNR